MTNWRWTVAARLQVTKSALGLATLLVPLVIAAPSGEAQEPLTLTVLYSFKTGRDGAEPNGNLVRDKMGNLYGTTALGGNQGTNCPLGCGTVYRLDTKTGTETVLYRFRTSIHGDGSQPSGGLVMDETGNLYGTTPRGGNVACDCGTVFKLDPTIGTETVLYRFTGGADGGFPASGLLPDGAGNLYGTTYYGGNGCPGGCGTVFKVDAAGIETVLYSFSGGTDGAGPNALARDQVGNFYGTTSIGGNLSCNPGGGCGTVFKLVPNSDRSWTESVLHSFTGTADLDGIFPEGGLVLDAGGNLYGTTPGGGLCFQCGTVFKLDPTTGTETVLYLFTGGVDGGFPFAGLVLDLRGNLYGTTSSGGNVNFGTVFKVDPTGKETILHSFHRFRDGGDPHGGLLRDSMVLYGTTIGGGTNKNGTVFRLSR